MITGANSGIGKEMTKFFASKGATVYMVCRNKERAIAARNELVSVTNNQNIHVLLGDCSLEKDVRRIWNEFSTHQISKVGTNACKSINSDISSSKEDSVLLDALICNAGALAKTKTLTDEGVEETFGAHLLFGTYLLGSY